MERPTGPLRRTDRLRTPTEFREVGRHGRRSASARVVLLVLEREGGCRLGITVSRKVGNAVARNRIKRRIREWFRGARWRMARSVDLVVIARPAIRELPGSELVRELESRSRELGLLDGRVGA